jgi:hypothetical protein
MSEMAPILYRPILPGPQQLFLFLLLGGTNRRDRSPKVNYHNGVNKGTPSLKSLIGHSLPPLGSSSPRVAS